MAAPSTTANRTILATAGLILLLGGTWLATARAALAERLPAGWPVPPPHAALLDREALADLRTHGWWTPAVTAAAVLATVLLVGGLMSRLQARRPSRLPLAAAGGFLSRSALEEALTERAASIDGIGRCRTRIRTRRQCLHLDVRVWLDPDTTPDNVIEPLTALAAEAEAATAPYEIATRLRMSHLTHRMPHVR
ncbi:hypothetical protein [Streptomyces sp. SPB4]|uniref:hypothetical protein n=1 Tax=Streptomyces sp. SPB4 TaxID=2940553 RepID=UPI0024745A5A|nr:hypothetical protein [Streptomyces sp. SPB4]MDH6543705.1 hypothetical protein [Streptomyces sp. SPB4]